MSKTLTILILNKNVEVFDIFNKLKLSNLKKEIINSLRMIS